MNIINIIKKAFLHIVLFLYICVMFIFIKTLDILEKTRFGQFARKIGMTVTKCEKEKRWQGKKMFWTKMALRWIAVKRLYYGVTINFEKTVHLHKDAHNSNLLKTDGTKCKLFDFMKKGRPLVINFGSCT